MNLEPSDGLTVRPWLRVFVPVLDDHQNPRLIKDLLQDLSSTLCVLITGVGKSVLVGSVDVWVRRLDRIVTWQQQLRDLPMTQVGAHSSSLTCIPSVMSF